MRNYSGYLSVCGMCLIILLNVTVVRAAESHSWSSDVVQTNVIELYTSQGCSSCPPADRWLSKFKNDARLWKTIIPIAFHVDYWDYIGWKDKFANPAFSQRQRQYARLSSATTVYTPGFFVNGKEWRQYFRFKQLPGLPTRRIGKLEASLTGSTVTARFYPLANQDTDLLLNVAILGLNIHTPIKAGENEGKVLSHEFVVLHHATATSHQENQWTINDLPLTSQHTKHLALVTWVSKKDNPYPIQTTGGPLLF